ncbi:hypothetical protein EV356DRAFT_13383 [Viridothelium virens]|uniref:Uncharacterized protein n=1 Tax=Viridothelium virens TaxID=1048519 RepID=A0A6A6HHL8_VIRVR|nr:hypothetical protein EV356DRAFT_13383 [Viridothelium virens]
MGTHSPLNWARHCTCVVCSEISEEAREFLILNHASSYAAWARLKIEALMFCPLKMTYIDSRVYLLPPLAPILTKLSLPPPIAPPPQSSSVRSVLWPPLLVAPAFSAPFAPTPMLPFLSSLICHSYPPPAWPTRSLPPHLRFHTPHSSSLPCRILGPWYP